MNESKARRRLGATIAAAAVLSLGLALAPSAWAQKVRLSTNLGDIVTLAAHPGTFLSSTVDADVRALYELLVPRLDGHPDKEEAAKVRELAKKAAKRGRGWFGR